MPFCSNCGQQIQEGAKFCAGCGSPTTVNNSNASKRTAFYDGELHKCPNCGEVLKAFEINCPACGYEIRGSNTINSAREFALRLVDAENDEQRITLIKSFPIPNSKEDILEFMIVASTNFDATANMSGNGVMKSVSDAWLAKVEQSYQKAVLLFVNDPDFSKIQNVYDHVCSKIKASIAVEKKKNIIQMALSTIGLLVGLLMFLIAFIIDVGSSSANTSMLHIGGAVVLIIGACTTSRRKSILDVGIGAIACVLTILLGMLLEETFGGNGSLMVLGGGLSLIIVIVQLFRSAGKKQ